MKKAEKQGQMTKPVLSGPDGAMCRNLVCQYYSIQEIRKGIANAKNMIDRDYEGEAFNTLPQEEVLKQVTKLEKDIVVKLTSYVSQVKIYAWLQSIDGIGPIITAGLISGIQDPAKFDNPAKLIRYCGLSVVSWCKNCDKRYVEGDKQKWAMGEAKIIESRKAQGNIKGKTAEIMKHLCSCDKPQIVNVAEKKRMGLPIHYSPFLKTLSWKLGNLGFVMKKGFYRTWYDKYKLAEQKKSPDLSKGHIHNRAIRKTVKLFISHLWNAWRRANGLSIVTPYVIKMGGAHNYIAPPNEMLISTLANLEKEEARIDLKPNKTKRANKQLKTTSIKRAK